MILCQNSDRVVLNDTYVIIHVCGIVIHMNSEATEVNVDAIFIIAAQCKSLIKTQLISNASRNLY